MKFTQFNIAMIAAVALASCGRTDADLIDHIPDSTAVVYMPQATRLPAEYVFQRNAGNAEIVYGASYGGPHKPKSDINVQFTVDPGKIPGFNDEFFTRYPIMPAGSFELERKEAAIPTGQVSTSPMNITLYLDKLEGVGGYLLPVTISTGAKMNESLRTTYFLVKALYDENPFPMFDRTNWEVTGISSEETTGEGANNGRAVFALDGNPATFWTTQWKAAKPGPPHHILIDMKETKKLHGFTFTARVTNGTMKATGNPKGIMVEAGTDGLQWPYREEFTLGNTELNTIYLAYPPQARYFKITINTSQGDIYLTHFAELNAF
ncbi:BT_3987 domain-containing protein [Chitinophaga rhizosphaerae]|uniref:BT_3987 domain-containing protein n=1 Tax=Chitinophaga rhizosphaerae TaxID=1864947 RepID=UPI000F813849|nr:DUF1735 domain-containing protein [Chitinophaga rhizosphaerae]